MLTVPSPSHLNQTKLNDLLPLTIDGVLVISSSRGKIIPSRREKFYRCCHVLHRVIVHAKGTLMLDYETKYRKIEKDIFGGRRKIFSPIGAGLIIVKKYTLPNFRAN